MNETTKRAIEDYNKIYAEKIKAYKARTEAEKAAAEAWKAYDEATPGGVFERIKTKAENELYNKFKEADAAQKKAADALRIAEAAEAAAGVNAARAAAEELKAAIIATPEKFKTPINSKRFYNAMQKEIENTSFCVSARFYTVEIIFSCNYSTYKAYLATTETQNGEVNPEKINAGYYTILTAAEIKKEARQAAKDAKKIEELQKEAARKAEEIKGKYKSDIKNYLPLLHTLPIEGAKYYN